MSPETLRPVEPYVSTNIGMVLFTYDTVGVAPISILRYMLKYDPIRLYSILSNKITCND